MTNANQPQPPVNQQPPNQPQGNNQIQHSQVNQQQVPPVNQQPPNQSNVNQQPPQSPYVNQTQQTQVDQQSQVNQQAQQQNNENQTQQNSEAPKEASTVSNSSYDDGPKKGGKGFKQKTDNALHNTEGCINEVLNTTDDKVGKPIVGFSAKIGASFKKWFKL